jgi:hypothetical protein
VEETGVPTTCHKSLTNFITSIDIVEMGGGTKKKAGNVYSFLKSSFLLVFAMKRKFKE